MATGKIKPKETQLKVGQRSPLAAPDQINLFAKKWRQKFFDRLIELTTSANS